MALQFPNSPTENQLYVDTTTGNQYRYNVSHTRWDFVANAATSVIYANDSQLLYTTNKALTGSNVATINATANVVYVNSLNAATNVTTQRLNVAQATVSGDLFVQGNATISGVTTYVNTTTILVGDNNITLNADIPAGTAPTENASIDINRGAYGNSSIEWNETADRWDLKVNTSVLMSILATGAVGIGNTAPVTKLEVAGNMAVDAFVENSANITTNYTISTGRNAMTAGPITINNGISVTVPSNSTWTIV